MEAIKLKPLSENALFSQFYHLFGGSYNWNHDRLDRSQEKDGKIIDVETGQVYLLATEEEEQAFRDAKKEAEIKALEVARTKYDYKTKPFIDYNNPERWRKGLDAVGDGETVEMCEEAFDTFLESVPPKRMDGAAYCSGEPSHHNKQGQAVYLCGIRKENRYFAQNGTVSQFDKKELFKSLPLEDKAA